MKTSRTVYIMGGYLPAGGARMTYEFGRIAQQLYNCKCIVVHDQKWHSERRIFQYNEVYETISFANFMLEHSGNDLFICNPSFSDGSLGFEIRAKKLMYIQGFNTFSVLDCRFDKYVSVSGFVHTFIQTTYDISTEVIPPFIEVSNDQDLPWQTRSSKSTLVYLKDNGNLQNRLLMRFCDECSNLFSLAEPSLTHDFEKIIAGSLSQSDLLKILGSYRYFVSLSTCEGFGLVPLEAMALGSTVVAFDGFGGRDYFERGKNSLVRAFPDIEGLARDFVSIITDDNCAEKLALRGKDTASGYSYARFKANWESVLAEL